MGGLYNRQVAATRNASKPVKLITIPPLPEEAVKHLIHLLQNDVAEKQRSADEGEFDFSQGQSVILLNICHEKLE